MSGDTAIFFGLLAFWTNLFFVPVTRPPTAGFVDWVSLLHQPQGKCAWRRHRLGPTPPPLLDSISGLSFQAWLEAEG